MMKVFYLTKDDQPAEPKTFTQEEVNHIVAEDRRKDKSKIEELSTLNAELSKRVTMSEEERSQFEAKIKTLNESSSSQVQELERKFTKEKKDYDKTISDLQSQASAWKDRFSNALIDQEIIQASTATNAYYPSQIASILRGSNKLEVRPILDADGKETQEYEAVVVDFKELDAKGNPVKSTLKISKAIERMVELPEIYGANLFKQKGSHGLNLSNPNASKTSIPDGTDAEEWANYRKTHGL